MSKINLIIYSISILGVKASAGCGNPPKVPEPTEIVNLASVVEKMVKESDDKVYDFIPNGGCQFMSNRGPKTEVICLLETSSKDNAGEHNPVLKTLYGTVRLVNDRSSPYLVQLSLCLKDRLSFGSDDDNCSGTRINNDIIEKSYTI